MTDDDRGGSSHRPPPRRLMRSTTDQRIAGVAGGIGRYFGIDPVLVRIAFVLLALAGGGGFLLYLVCWVLLPADDGTQAAPAQPLSFSDTPVWVRGVLIAGGVLLVLSRIVDGGSSFWWGLLLIGIGVLLFRDDDRRQQRPGWESSRPAPWSSDSAGSGSAPAPSQDLQTSAEPRADEPRADDLRADEPWEDESREEEPWAVEPLETDTWTTDSWQTQDLGASGASPLSWSSSTAVATPPARPTRPTSVLARLTVGIAALVVGFAAVVDQFGGSDLTLTRGLALALLVVGIGCLVGAVAGRGRGLIVLGLLLLPLLLVTATLSVPFGEVRDVVLTPTTAAEVAEPIQIGAGELLVDLRQLDAGSQTVPVEVRQGVGQLHVLVPAGAGFEVDARTSAGEIRIDDGDAVDAPRFQTESGVGVRMDYVASAADDDEPTYDLDLQLGAGQIIIERASLR